MSALESLLAQALRLSDAERGKLAVQLLRTLEPEDEDEASKEAWEAAWSAEIDRRVREVDDGSAELLDGDEVLARSADLARRTAPVKRSAGLPDGSRSAGK